MQRSFVLYLEHLQSHRPFAPLGFLIPQGQTPQESVPHFCGDLGTLGGRLKVQANADAPPAIRERLGKQICFVLLEKRLVEASSVGLRTRLCVSHRQGNPAKSSCSEAVAQLHVLWLPGPFSSSFS